MKLRYFKHKATNLVFAANSTDGYWVTEHSWQPSIYTDRDGESFVVNGAYEELGELPKWAAPKPL